MKKRKCFSCGKEYEYCPTCPAYDNLPTYMGMFCCEECKTVFMTLTDYGFGKKTAEEVKDILAPYEIKDFTKFSDGMQKQLKEIYKPVAKKVRKKKEPVVECKLEEKESVVEIKTVSESISKSTK